MASVALIQARECAANAQFALNGAQQRIRELEQLAETLNLRLVNGPLASAARASAAFGNPCPWRTEWLRALFQPVPRFE